MGKGKYGFSARGMVQGKKSAKARGALKAVGDAAEAVGDFINAMVNMYQRMMDQMGAKGVDTSGIEDALNTLAEHAANAYDTAHDMCANEGQETVVDMAGPMAWTVVGWYGSRAMGYVDTSIRNNGGYDGSGISPGPLVEDIAGEIADEADEYREALAEAVQEAWEEYIEALIWDIVTDILF